MVSMDGFFKRLGYISKNAVITPPSHSTLALTRDEVDIRVDETLTKEVPWLTQATLDYLRAISPSISKPLRKSLQSALNKGVSNALLATMETIQSAYVAPSVSGIGPAKQMLTEWWFNPIWGQPRLVDLKTIKQLARGHFGSMAIEMILDQIMQVDWDIIPRYRHQVDRPSDQRMSENEQIQIVEDFFAKPNRNNYNMDQILRMLLRNILETDDGVIVKVFEEYQRPSVPNVQIASTGDIRAYTAQPAWDAVPVPGSPLVEIFAEDGSSFLRQTDMHGYLMNYWQYSFIVPRRPVRFEVNEIIYIMQNPRSGSPYGYSPFESIVDGLNFLYRAQVYNEHFYENSALPALQIDYPWIKTVDEMREMGAFVEDSLMGPDKSYRSLITNGGTKVQVLNFDPEKLQMLQMQNFYLQLVLAKLKVPASLLGISLGGRQSGMGGGGASAMATQNAVAKSRAIKPLMTLVENELNQKLLPDIVGLPYKDTLVEFKWGEIVDMEERERTAKVDQVYLATGVSTVNEVRLRDGRDPVPWGNQPFIPGAALYAGLTPTPVPKVGGGGSGKSEGQPFPGDNLSMGSGKAGHPFQADARQLDTPQGTTQGTASRFIGQGPTEGRSGSELAGGAFNEEKNLKGDMKARQLNSQFIKLLTEAKQRLERGETYKRVEDDTISAATGFMNGILHENSPASKKQKERAMNDFRAVLQDLNKVVRDE